MAAQLRFSPLPTDASAATRRLPFSNPRLPYLALSSRSSTSSPNLRRLLAANPNLSQPLASNPNPSLSPSPGGGGIDNPPGSGGGGGGGGGGGDDHRSDKPSDGWSPLDLFLSGWRARVAADPQFPFKVLMEELVGVSACVLGDMATRPNFGLNELDFVFCTLIVGSILNFVLMYLLAPTSLASTSLAAASPFPSHMFEPGPYSPLARLATVVSKGATFAAVGFAAGLVGTAISNGLIAVRKKMDPEFETPNKPPPTLLNSVTWAIHMGVSSNLRYQTLNGMEYVMERVLPAAGFKASVVALRCFNNVMGGVSFVTLARMTGSQKAAVKEERVIEDEGKADAVAVDDRDKKEL